MANSYFQFQQFIIHQDRCAMKVTTDSCLFGAWAAEKMRKQELTTAHRIMDIGAGTGLLSLMLTQQVNGHIDAVEIDPAAAAQAKENIAASPWADRITVWQEDVKKLNGSLPRQLYDIIISNPPFYENELASPDKRKNIAHHQQGLLMPELLTAIHENLGTGGEFYLMLPYKRLAETVILLEKFHFSIRHLTLVRQTWQHDPFRVFIVAKQSSGKDENYQKEEIVIRGEDGAYTPLFSELLKDYYLHLGNPGNEIKPG